MQNIKLITDCENNRYRTNQVIKYKDVTVPLNYMSDGFSKILNKYPPRGMRGAIVHDYV